jgi:hypothetical protein
MHPDEPRYQAIKARAIVRSCGSLEESRLRGGGNKT